MNPTQARLADLAQKSVVLTCVAASAWGLYGIYIMHNERLRQGREALAKHDMGELKMLRDTTGDKFAQLKR